MDAIEAQPPEVQEPLKPISFGRLALLGLAIWFVQLLAVLTLYSFQRLKSHQYDINNVVAVLLLNMIYAVVLVYLLSRRKRNRVKFKRVMSTTTACVLLFLFSTVFNAFSDIKGTTKSNSVGVPASVGKS
jgi:uncharacterized membrane protein YozB (DUF420 family)